MNKKCGGIGWCKVCTMMEAQRLFETAQALRHMVSGMIKTDVESESVITKRGKVRT